MRTLLGVAAVVSGCATDYVPPAAGVPSASMVLSTTTYGNAVFQGKSAASCPSSTSMNLAAFSFTLNGASLQESAKRSSTARLLPAERPYYLSAEIGGTTCKLATVFVPRQSAEYEAVLRATNNRCLLEVYRRTAVGALVPEPSAGPVAQRADICK